MPEFTGFAETTYRDADGELVREMSTTISEWPVERILDRLRQRMGEAKPGTHLRVDLIAWDGESEDAAFPPLDTHTLRLTDDELDALWKLLVTDGSKVNGALKVRTIGKVQTLVEGLPS